MTIEASQIDFMNYSRFFKDDYRKGLYRFKTMLADPSQYQTLINNPISLSAAFGPDDVQTPRLCDVVYELDKTKREAIANKYASLFGHSNYTEMLKSSNTPFWTRRNLFMMLFSSQCNKQTLLKSIEYSCAREDWIGKTMDFGPMRPYLGDYYICKGEYTIIGTLHDDLVSGNKALYTFATKDGEIMTYMSNNPYQLSMDDRSPYNKSWGQTSLRTRMQDFYFEDTAVNAVIKSVTKLSCNEHYQESFSSKDKFWIPSLTELGFDNPHLKENLLEGKVYPYFARISPIRYQYNSQEGLSYWTRSKSSSGNLYFYITPTGERSDQTYSRNDNLVVCFCM